MLAASTTAPSLRDITALLIGRHRFVAIIVGTCALSSRCDTFGLSARAETQARKRALRSATDVGSA